MNKLSLGILGLIVMIASPARAAAPVLNWTGFYAGGHLGWAWVEEEKTLLSDAAGAFAPGTRFCCDRTGFIGGAQLGFNWQIRNWVLGVEGDWSWTNSQTTVVQNSTIIPGFVQSNFAKDKWYATLTGRIGYAVDRSLIYVKGGAAWLNSDRGATETGVPGIGNVAQATRNDTFSGWTLGAGIEWALMSNWSVKAEYNYMDFGTKTRTFSNASPAAIAGTFAGTDSFDTYVHVAKVGFNYRFNWGTGR
jgi:outer membrane immunogenic protein